ALQMRFDTVRVDLSDFDTLLSSLTEARSQIRGLRELRDRLQRKQHATAAELSDLLVQIQHDLSNRLGRAEQELLSAYEQVSTLRLMRVSVLFPSLELSVRDTAQLLGKQVELECQGGEIRVEANVLSAVRDALLHMVRNAVDHGIEPEALRRQRQKNPI